MKSRLLNAFGLIAMLAVILVMIPLTLPKLLGLRIYGVQTSSMTPLYYMGGVIYVKDAGAADIQVGDVITYRLDDGLDLVETHRVMEITDTTFITKGDNNDSYDPEPVRWDRLVGRPVYYIPYLGLVAGFIATLKGKLIMAIIFILSLCMWLLADILKQLEARHSKTSKSQEMRKDDGEVLQEKDDQGGEKSGTLLQIAGILLTLCAVFYIGYIGYGYVNTDKEYSSLEQTVIQGIKPNVPQTAEGTKPNPTEQLSEAVTDPEAVQEPEMLENPLAEVTLVEASVDQRTVCDNLKELQKDYPVIIGWIVIDGTDISYPIVHSDNNDNYLRRTYDGKNKTAGSIFVESSNKPDFGDSHTIIYGHNMRNGSMFGGLRQYKEDPEFYEDHKYITIYTSDSILTYEIYAYSDVDVESPVYRVEFYGEDDLNQVIREIKRRSYRATELAETVWAGDKLLTLSTCSTTGKRFIVNAKLVQVEE